MNDKKISVVLATFNEEKNLKDCLESIKDITDDIVIVDGTSTDRTVEIAKRYNARIVITKNHPIFHINKQKAIDLAKHEWILQLDADERVSKELAKEIIALAEMNEEEIEDHQKNLSKKKLFFRHQQLIEERDGKIGKQKGTYNAFFIPRLNYFLGRYLRYGGVYPDGVIRLIRKGKAYLPCKDVHEQMVVEGKVGWLQNDLYHYDSPTFARYLLRNSRYIDLITSDLKEKQTKKNVQNFIRYIFILPISWFLQTYIRHKGFLDGWQGFVFSFFSALRFPRAYIRFLKN